MQQMQRSMAVMRPTLRRALRALRVLRVLGALGVALVVLAVVAVATMGTMMALAATPTSHANANASANANIVVAANLTYDQLGGQPYTVDYDYRSFRINGQRILLQSGSVHYPRSPPDMWPQILQTLRAAGLNTLQTYVFWNYHEIEEGTWDFTTESRNLGAFLQAAADVGLFVNLRLGPYVCAEWFNGGIPVWLYGRGFEFRQFNDGWTTAMAYFIHNILAYVEPYLARNGGPIIMAQIENEYGDRGPVGNEYVYWCGNLTQQVAIDVPWVMCQQWNAPDPVVFACNGWDCDTQVVYQQVTRQQPAVWTENWTGWFTTFGSSLPSRPVENIAYAVALFVARGGSFHNYYMWHGGTMHGNYAGGPGIVPSYDYDAPIDEFGIPRDPKFSRLGSLHNVLTSYATALLSQNLSSPVSQGSYSMSFTYGTLGQPGSVVFLFNQNTTNADKFTFAQQTFSLAPYAAQIVDGATLQVVYDSTVASSSMKRAQSENYDKLVAGATAPLTIAHFPEPVSIWSQDPIINDSPLEQIRATLYLTPYMLYQTTVNLTSEQIAAGTVEIFISQAGDTEHIYLDNTKVLTARYATNWSWNADVSSFSPGAHEFKIMNVLQGMNNGPTGLNGDGLLGYVLFGGENITSQEWQHQIGTYGEFIQIYEPSSVVATWNSTLVTDVPMMWYKLEIPTPAPSVPFNESYWTLDMSGMGRGFVWVNGFNVGAFADDIATYPACETTCNYTGVWNYNRCRFGCGSKTQTHYMVPRTVLAPVGENNLVVLIDETGGDPTTIELVWHIGYARSVADVDNVVDAPIDSAVDVEVA